MSLSPVLFSFSLSLSLSVIAGTGHPTVPTRRSLPAQLAPSLSFFLLPHFSRSLVLALRTLSAFQPSHHSTPRLALHYDVDLCFVRPPFLVQGAPVHARERRPPRDEGSRLEEADQGRSRHQGSRRWDQLDVSHPLSSLSSSSPSLLPRRSNTDSSSSRSSLATTLLVST